MRDKKSKPVDKNRKRKKVFYDRRAEARG